MKFLKLATSKEENAQIRQKTKSLLDEAERIKSSQTWTPNVDLLVDLDSPGKDSSDNHSSQATPTKAHHSTLKIHDASTGNHDIQKKSTDPVSSRPLTAEENSILLRSSKVHGHIFPRWNHEVVRKTLEKAQQGPIFV